MAGADERHDIGANVVPADALAGFRVLRGEEKGQNIIGRAGARRQQALARADDVVDGAGEEFEGRASAQASETRQKLRRANQIERIETADRVEIAGYRHLEFARVAAEPLREQRLLKHL